MSEPSSNEPSSTDARLAVDDLSGCELAGYRILGRLGRGAMAEVYLAEQHSLRRRVALKVLKRELACDPAYVQRFHHEAQAAASLVHANIVQIYEIGCFEGLHFIAQEYVEGTNLAELIAKAGPAQPQLAISVARQVAAALARAAELGVVHRDIKPENILLATSGDIKVADFGLARLTAPNVAMNLTQVGYTMGTPLYMSPEQIEGRPLDVRSDLYSLGVTCYHVLAGRPPFAGQTAVHVALQHLNVEPEPLAHLRPELPDDLCRIVHKLLAKKPEERYAAPTDLLDDLPMVSAASAIAGAGGVRVGSSIATDAAVHRATERLAVLMNTPGVKTSWPWSWTTAALATAFAVGLAAAWFAREAPLL